jgi:D-serine deaminase-like pyridoxal phosphate-dependent protein
MAPAAQPAERTTQQTPAVSEVATPFVLIDGRRLRRNIIEMQDAVSGLGASLRPHFKTHRTTAIARLQREAGAIGLTVATVPQLLKVRAEFACPVLVSSLLQADAAVAEALGEACADGTVMFAVESVRSVELLRAAVGPAVGVGVMIEVEAGCQRCGVDPADCAEVARAAALLGFDVAGVFSYPGHGYILGQSQAASDDEQVALAEASSALRRAGFDPAHVSAGSSPTMPYARSGVATEYRPGTYVFGDRQQLTLGSIGRSQLSLTVVASVIAVHGDRIVLDAGGKALGRDAPPWLSGFGQLAGESEAPITRLYDHHSVIESYRGAPVSVGDRLAILPNNANSVMALLRSAWMTDDGVSARELTPQPDR